MYISIDDIVGVIRDEEVIARGRAIRTFAELNRKFGRGRWRKMKGVATVRMKNGSIQEVELHWYEAHGIGKKSIKIKRYLA